MIVYLLIQHVDYEGIAIKGVYLTKEKADRERRAHDDRNEQTDVHYDVEEWMATK